MLRYYWNRYKKIKKAKAAAAKAKKDALAKKKRSRTVKAPVIEPLPVPTKGKKGKNVQVVKTNDANILNIISSEIKEIINDVKEVNGE